MKEKVRQSRPLPVRLQSAVSLQEAAGAAVQAALEAAEKSRQIYEAMMNDNDMYDNRRSILSRSSVEFGGA